MSLHVVLFVLIYIDGPVIWLSAKGNKVQCVSNKFAQTYSQLITMGYMRQSLNEYIFNNSVFYFFFFLSLPLSHTLSLFVRLTVAWLLDWLLVYFIYFVFFLWNLPNLHCFFQIICETSIRCSIKKSDVFEIYCIKSVPNENSYRNITKNISNELWNTL